MSKKKTEDYRDKYELMVDPGVIITRAPDRQRIDLRKLSVQQADKLYASEGQQILRKKAEKGDKNAAEGSE